MKYYITQEGRDLLESELDEGLRSAVKGTVRKVRDYLGMRVPGMTTSKEHQAGFAKKRAQYAKQGAEDKASDEKYKADKAYKESPEGIRKAKRKKQRDEIEAGRKARREREEYNRSRPTTNDVYGRRVYSDTGKPHDTTDW